MQYTNVSISATSQSEYVKIEEACHASTSTQMLLKVHRIYSRNSIITNDLVTPHRITKTDQILVEFNDLVINVLALYVLLVCNQQLSAYLLIGISHYAGTSRSVFHETISNTAEHLLVKANKNSVNLHTFDTY